jgi:creatinine amidohydrolase/Fe(II)-dependent formamide hydrolase-like protein
LIDNPDTLRSVYLPLDMKRQTRHGGSGQPTLATAKKGGLFLQAVLTNAAEVIKAIRCKTVPK